MLKGLDLHRYFRWCENDSGQWFRVWVGNRFCLVKGTEYVSMSLYPGWIYQQHNADDSLSTRYSQHNPSSTTAISKEWAVSVWRLLFLDIHVLYFLRGLAVVDHGVRCDREFLVRGIVYREWLLHSSPRVGQRTIIRISLSTILANCPRFGLRDWYHSCRLVVGWCDGTVDILGCECECECEERWMQCLNGNKEEHANKFIDSFIANAQR